MINLSLIELAVATCFSSERLADFYKQYLLQPERLFSDGFIEREAFNKECRDILAQSLDSDYPRKFRLNELDSIFELVWPNNVFYSDELPILDHCFESLLTDKNSFICYRQDRVINYSRLLARFDTAILVGWYLAKNAHKRAENTIENKRALQNLKIYIEQLNPIFVPNPHDKDSYAENHTHLGGMHYDGIVIVSGLLNQNFHITDKKVSDRLTPLFDLIRLFLAQSNELDNNNVKGIESTIINVINHNWMISDAYPIDLSIYADERFGHAQSSGSLVFIRKQLAIAIKKNQLSKAWIWLNVYLWYCYRQANSFYVRISIIYLITELMAVRRQLIMDGRGLTRFVQYYNRPMRVKSAGDRAKMFDSINKLFIGEYDKAEIKLSPEAITLEAIVFFISQIYKNQPEKPVDKLKFFTTQLDRWHICVHFLRRKEFQNKPQLVWEKVYQLHQKLIEAKLWYHPRLDVDNQLQLNPRNWIKGLDVAGDENLTSTEVFAPAIRWLRNIADVELNHSFHLSIHAGEDFAHPLTGMRNIDETIEFCGFRPKDRIGHGLAIGIKPQDWFNVHGDVLIDVDEHFDNLVWAWGYCKDLTGKFEVAALVFSHLEQKIKALSKEVSWLKQAKLTDANIDEYWHAWQLRKNCFHQYQQSLDFSLQSNLKQTVIPDFDSLNDGSVAGRIYLSRWRNRTCAIPLNLAAKTEHQSSKVYITDNADIKFPQKTHNMENVLIDSVSAAEIEFYHLLQDILLNKLMKNQIIIEVNLSSNVYIANIEDYYLHPIFRWFPIDERRLDDKFEVREGVNLVCVNTDDAGIMPTTLRTEFELLEKAAKRHCNEDQKIQDWIEKLKKVGVTIFEDNHINLHETFNSELFLRDLYSL